MSAYSGAYTALYLVCVLVAGCGMHFGVSGLVLLLLLLLPTQHCFLFLTYFFPIIAQLEKKNTNIHLPCMVLLLPLMLSALRCRNLNGVTM